MISPVGFIGFAVAEDKLKTEVAFNYDGKEYTLNHGSVVIASITSCTNTSNPEVLISAGLIARNAVKKGLRLNIL